MQLSDVGLDKLTIVELYTGSQSVVVYVDKYPGGKSQQGVL